MPENRNLQIPFRVLPGRLSVSRTFGDIEAKAPKYQGNPNVIIAVPDITTIRITDATDFIILGCDGIFDELRTGEVGRIVWAAARKAQKAGESIHNICGACAVAVLERAMQRRSLDNVTVVMLAFKNFQRALQVSQQVHKPIHAHLNSTTSLPTAHPIPSGHSRILTTLAMAPARTLPAGPQSQEVLAPSPALPSETAEGARPSPKRKLLLNKNLIIPATPNTPISKDAKGLTWAGIRALIELSKTNKEEST
jgi:hypothetical protein